MARRDSPNLDFDQRLWKRIVPPHVVESVPCETRSLTSPIQPLVPSSQDREHEQVQAAAVPIHAKVVIVPNEAPFEPSVLFLDRTMSMTSAPFNCGRNGPPEARFASLDPWHPAPRPCSGPVMGEPEKVEGHWPLAPAHAATRRTVVESVHAIRWCWSKCGSRFALSTTLSSFVEISSMF